MNHRVAMFLAGVLGLAPLGGCQKTGTNTRVPSETVAGVAQELRPVGATSGFETLTAEKVVLIDLWATWCTACKETMPRVQLLSERHGGGELVVVGVNVGETAADVARYTQEAGVDYPQFLDPEFHFADVVGAAEIPMFLVVDRSGTIVHRGTELDQGVLGALDELLNE